MSLSARHRGVSNRTAHGLLESADQRVAHTLRQAPPGVIAVLDARRGRPLESGVRNEFEPLVGRDLSHVRIRDDAVAAASAEVANARAYSAGNEIVFGPGRYAPDTAEGRVLLAHELGHVLTSTRPGSMPAPILRAPKEGTGEGPSLLPGVPAPRVSTLGASTIATIYFARDIGLMEPDGFAAVQKLATQLSYMAKPFVSVEGHASSEGPQKHNEDLARLRREAVVAVLSSKAHGVTFAGSGHGASDPAVAETATEPGELEAQRAKNRRVTIVITDMTPGSPPTPTVGPGTLGAPDITKLPPPRPETPEEEANRRLKEMLKLPAKIPPVGPGSRSLSEQFWKGVDDKLDAVMSKIGVPQQARGLIKDGAHALIEKGAGSLLDSALNSTNLSTQDKNAIKAAIGAAAQTKF
jgi:outer membrane protein OmpA-like peptidoglycan-associated protein